MNQRIDDLLNRYVDNDLSSSELKEVKSLIESDTEVLKNLKTLEAVDNNLHNLEVAKAPEGFTSKVMTKITDSIPSIKVTDNKTFFMILISFFTVLFGGLAISLISFSPSKLNLWNFSISDKLSKLVPSKIPSINISSLVDNGVMLAAVFACVLIVFGFFIYDTHKNFKKKINGLG